MADVEFSSRRDRFGVPMVVIDGIRYKESELHKSHKARLPQETERLVTGLFAAPEVTRDDLGASEQTQAPSTEAPLESNDNPLSVPLDSTDYAVIKQRVEDLGLQTATQKKVDLLAALDAYYGGL